MSEKIIYPPRPKGKMLPSDLPYYESTGKWLAQRKFRGSNSVIFISSKREVTLGSRHGDKFAKFVMGSKQKEEFITGLNLKPDTEYWFNGELMNKDVDATNEIILYDLLQAGRYLFGMTQSDRLQQLSEICGNTQNLCYSKIALQVTPKIWLAEVFYSDFVNRFNESFQVQQLEGLVLRKKNATLDNYGQKEYVTTDLIRCRKPFMAEAVKEGRSGGYDF